MEWIKRHISQANNLSRFNWEDIFTYVDSELSDADPKELWHEVGLYWMNTLIQDLPEGYRIKETDNFLLLSKADDSYSNSLSGFLERCLRRLKFILKGIANDEGYGKHVVIIFDEIDTYYDYTGFYGPQEGTYGLSSGMYLNYGYGHFVFPHQTLDLAEPIVAHEMTHALLCHLPIPVWLNEGMAVNMEAMITGFEPPRLDKELFAKHEAYWGDVEIQEFWYGDSFFKPDDGQQLSYQLAQILVTNLSKQDDAFVEFCNLATWKDSGDAAMEEIFGISPGDMIANFLGSGDWYPNPAAWPKT